MLPISRIPRIPPPRLEVPPGAQAECFISDRSKSYSLIEVMVSEMDKSKDYRATACFEVLAVPCTNHVTSMKLLRCDDSSTPPSATVMLPGKQPGASVAHSHYYLLFTHLVIGWGGWGGGGVACDLGWTGSRG